MDNSILAEKIRAFLERNPCDLGAMEDLFGLCRSVDDQEFGHRLNKEVRRYNAEALRHGNRSQIQALLDLQKRSLLFDAPVELDSYLRYVEWDRDREKRFYLPRRKVLYPVVQTLQDLMDDKLDLATISMPPGTGKSTLGIFFLSWIMGRWPDSPNLASAHSGLLTRSFYDGVNQIIQDPEYLYADVFPESKLYATNSKEETIDLVKFHRFSTLTCRAIGASLTGATRCEKLLYADDLVSGIEEAMSRERMDKLWMAYTNDLKSRKKEGAKELHIATRWSVHDPIGRLEQEYGGSDRAKFIVLPALNDDGESNFNYAYGVGFGKEYFEDMQKNLDDASFRALYQNQPIEREGLLYSEDELRRYFELPDGDPDAILAICDTKDKGTDYAFLPVVYQYGEDYYRHTPDSQATKLFEGSTTETNFHVELRQPATDIAVSVSGGTLVSYTAYAQAVDMILSSGTKTVTITGIKQTETEDVVAYQVSQNGELDKERNQLISNEEMRLALANHFIAYLGFRSTYDAEYRGNPELEVGDLIQTQTNYTSEMDALILVDELT